MSQTRPTGHSKINGMSAWWRLIRLHWCTGWWAASPLCAYCLYRFLIFHQILIIVVVVVSVYPRSQKGHGKVFVKKVIFTWKGTFTHALQYRGHFCNGTLLYQKLYWCMFYPAIVSFLPPFLQPISFHLPTVLSSFLSHLISPIPLSHLSSLSHPSCLPLLSALKKGQWFNWDM